MKPAPLTTGFSALLTAAGVLVACNADRPNEPAPDESTASQPTSAAEAPPPAIAESPSVRNAGLTFDTFRERMAEGFCSSLARCCLGDTTGAASDSGAFDRRQCEMDVQIFGFETSNLFDSTDSGPRAVVLDEAEAWLCIDRLKALSCSLGREEFAAARSACFAAVRGTIPLGGTCKESVDCVPGHFCNPSTTRCEAVRGEGQPCGDFTSDACTYRNSGDTNRYCEIVDTADPNFAVLPQSEWRCRTGRPNGALCANNLWCGEGLCDDRTDLDPRDGVNDFVCRPSIEYFSKTTPEWCPTYVRRGGKTY
jgi:hypothetical protein